MIAQPIRYKLTLDLAEEYARAPLNAMVLLEADRLLRALRLELPSRNAIVVDYVGVVFVV